jgi:hypothetical protein
MKFAAAGQLERKRKELFNQVKSMVPDKGIHTSHMPPGGAADLGEVPGVPPEGFIDVRHEFVPPTQPFLAGDGIAIAVGVPLIHFCTIGACRLIA